MPTRYVVDLDLKKIVDESGLKEGKAEARKAIKKVFEARYHQQSSAKKEKKAAGTMRLQEDGLGRLAAEPTPGPPRLRRTSARR